MQKRINTYIIIQQNTFNKFDAFYNLIFKFY